MRTSSSGTLIQHASGSILGSLKSVRNGSALEAHRQTQVIESIGMDSAMERYEIDEDLIGTEQSDIEATYLSGYNFNGSVVLDRVYSDFENNGSPLPVIHSRLKEFIPHHSFLLGFGIRQPSVTRGMMEDLFVQYGAVYKSWKVVKQAILSRSGLSISSHTHCSKGHEALLRHTDGSLQRCFFGNWAQNSAKLASFSYIGVWERLEARMGSRTEGPLLFRYFRRCLHSLANSGNENDMKYSDFFSGCLFKEAISELGRLQMVQNDIFLSFSTDGVSPFKSTEYNYRPCVLFVLNLPPSERFKLKNVMPICVIFGPKAPKDPLPFLRPTLNELEELRKGRTIRLWNGKESCKYSFAFHTI
ncbi:hypothetical protein BWQ96_03762 [Gracilariopsis chorda]|uniref:Uncharacterized protein n=1 Tax=Gracilariopsis chorda TaxID=448386 RepID=A0A2V3IXW5_9FLOR|nr:hypothetical protein BWQ96_03762 [Gracilariopsis chorda]|eukprot:PXF46527.1 hypothetical protein BWQ96_03762 [Gracilariopsis chorda]